MPTISGIVKDEFGQPCQAMVRAYRRSDGKFIGETISNATTGAYSITTLDTSPHVVYRLFGAVLNGDSYWPNVAASLHFSNGFTDSKGHTFTPYGTPTTEADATSPSGYAAVFNGSNYALAASNADFGIGTGSFTAEAWLKCAFTGSNMIAVDSRSSNSAVPWLFGVGSTGLFITYDGSNSRSGGQLIENAWNHVAYVRNGDACAAYVGGVRVQSWTSAADYGSARPIYLGENQAGYTERYTGRMAEFRLTVGACRYTSDFTPATGMRPDYANSVGAPTENAQIFDYVTPV